MLDTEVPTRDVGSFEIRVDRQEVAVGEQVGTPKGPRTRDSDDYLRCASASRVGELMGNVRGGVG